MTSGAAACPLPRRPSRHLSHNCQPRQQGPDWPCTAPHAAVCGEASAAQAACTRGPAALASQAKARHAAAARTPALTALKTSMIFWILSWRRKMKSRALRSAMEVWSGAHALSPWCSACCLPAAMCSSIPSEWSYQTSCCTFAWTNCQVSCGARPQCKPADISRV